MSINVQTSNGLKKISGENITSRKVLSAIGYVPAQASIVETHVNNKGIHITDSERAAWNAKSDFSGDYNHLTGAPNITEDESAILYIADKSGNIIAQIDQDGVYTTDVILSRNKKSVLNAINKLETLSYNDLKDRPDVLDDGSDNFLIVDPLGNIILKVDANGLYSTNAFIDGVDLSSKINEFNVHILNKEIHITQVEREAWNAKSNFDGDYNSLTNKPNVLENDLQSFNVTDKDGNVLFKVDKEAVYTNKLMINEKDVESALNALEVSIEKNKDDIELDGQNIESLKSRLDTLEPIVEAHTKSFVEDESGVLNIVDPAGKIALQIDKDATRVDNLEANNLKIGAMDVASEITKVATDLLNNYYTKTETNNNFDKINSANNAEKAAKEYADKQVSDLEEALKGNVSSDYNTLEKIEDEIDKTNTAIDTESKRAIDAEEELNKKISTNITNIGTNASKIEENKNTLNTHINDKIVHITNEERGLWNDASSKATNLEILTQDIRRDENVFAIVNEDGYIGFKVDETGTYANKLYASGNSKDIITQIKDARDFTTESINNVIDEAPGDYDTLNKIANKVSSKAEKEELNKLAANLNSNYYTSATTDEKIASANNAQTEALQKEIKDASDAITNGATADYNTLGKIEAQIKTKANNDTVTTLETLMNNEIDRSTKEDTRLAGLIGTNQNNINTNSSNIQTNKTNLTNHINNKEVHIQSNERENWDNALSKATNLEILTQDMQRDEKVFAILDKYNKVGFKVDEYGIAYTAKLVVDGEDVVEKIDNVQEEAIKHADDRIRDLIGGADEAYDTLKEIQKEIQENEGNISSFLAALETRASATDFENHKNNKNSEQHVTKDQITNWDSKAPGTHTHTKSQITDFPTSLKNPTSLTIQGNGTTLVEYDGSSAKTVNVASLDANNFTGHQQLANEKYLRALKTDGVYVNLIGMSANNNLVIGHNDHPTQPINVYGVLNIKGDTTVNGTLTANKVYNAVWNDYAEFFPRGEETEAGDIIALSLNSDNEVYIKATKDNKAIVGVESNEYGHILGGEPVSIEENMKNYIPVGLAGRVWVKVQGKPKKGDYIGASDIPGVGEVCDDKYNAIGICVDNNLKDGKCRIKII